MYLHAYRNQGRANFAFPVILVERKGTRVTHLNKASTGLVPAPKAALHHIPPIYLCYCRPFTPSIRGQHAVNEDRLPAGAGPVRRSCRGTE